MSEVTLESQLFDIIKDEKMPEYIKMAKLDMLVTLGVDVNAKDDESWTALMNASCCGHKDVVELLIEKGAKVNATAIEVAKDDETIKTINKAVRQRNIKEKGFIVRSIKNLFGRG